MRLTTKPNRSGALTRVEVLVVVAILLLFAAAFMVMLHKNRESGAHAARIKCVGNNKQIGLAFRVFAYDNDDKFPYAAPKHSMFGNETDAWKYFVSMSNELGSAKILMCPTDLERRKNMSVDCSSNSAPASLGLQFTRNSGVSYFIGLDADETRPGMLLLGDRNIETNAWNYRAPLLTVPKARLTLWTGELHGNCGNVTLADGSGQWRDSPSLDQQLHPGGLLTNRLLIPVVP